MISWCHPDVRCLIDFIYYSDIRWHKQIWWNPDERFESADARIPSATIKWIFGLQTSITQKYFKIHVEVCEQTTKLGGIRIKWYAKEILIMKPNLKKKKMRHCFSKLSRGGPFVQVLHQRIRHICNATYTLSFLNSQ